MCAELEKWGLEERQEGQLQGEGNPASLLKCLKADGRFQDMDKALDNEVFRKKLYEEYQIR